MSALRTPAASDRAGPTVSLAANLFPVVGVGVLGWQAAELLVVYWIEVVVMVVAYSVAALFAERAVDLDGRSFYIVGFSKRSELDPERWRGDPEPVGIVDRVLPTAIADRLPPIYRRNVPVVVRSLGIVGFLAVGALYLADSVVTDPIPTVTSPAVLLASLAVCVSQTVEIRREFFVTPRYEEWSSYMTLEAAQRVVTFYLCVGMVAVPLSFLVLVLVSGVFGRIGIDPAALGPLRPAGNVDATTLAFVVPFALAKTVVDRSRRLAFDEAGPSGFAGWFMPDDPRPEWQHER